MFTLRPASPSVWRRITRHFLVRDTGRGEMLQLNYT